jgi:hypothetical protein
MFYIVAIARRFALRLRVLSIALTGVAVLVLGSVTSFMYPGFTYLCLNIHLVIGVGLFVRDGKALFYSHNEQLTQKLQSA